MTDPDYLIKIHLIGDLPPVVDNLFKDYPDRELANNFFAATGFNRPGKELELDGKNIQLVLVDCNINDCKDLISDATVLFFKLSDRESFNRIGKIFNLSQKVNSSNRHKRSIIGLLDEPEHILQEERDELQNNKNVEYHEINPTDITKIEVILISIVEKSLLISQAHLKIVCLGGSERKTSIIRNYTESKSTVNYLPTIGVDITNKSINIHGLRVELIFVDTAGEKFFSKLRPSYYRGANGGIIFFEFDNRDSFNAIKNWHNELARHIPDSIPIALIGIEGEEPKIPVNKAQALAQDLKMQFYELKGYEHELNEVTKKMTELILTN